VLEYFDKVLENGREILRPQLPMIVKPYDLLELHVTGGDSFDDVQWSPRAGDEGLFRFTLAAAAWSAARGDNVDGHLRVYMYPRGNVDLADGATVQGAISNSTVDYGPPFVSVSAVVLLMPGAFINYGYSNDNTDAPDMLTRVFLLVEKLT
jgi:hypothetical protein